ncbi:flippase [Mesorhizobium sp. YIM 152430]|uniref:flippase n=1 Tax=Mesorhizobium sp. YIM 152430 TaxID=3031761 RepID=UPI0023DA1F1E|nr:flippase [Mesorhizobium sp. YIM 152430]MDF1598902.1 flippase [Mesorhizobium sp. YIM 152430]
MLLRHTLFNLLGLGLPLVVAVFTIPLLIEALGTAQFGLLTLIWAVVSYFGLFDLGLGRTLTLQMSVAESRGERERIAPAVATALTFMAILGVLVGALLVVGAERGIDLLAAVPEREEAVAALMAMGIAIPAITLTSGFRGMLEARHAFGIVNLIRLPMGIYTFLGPLLAVWLGEPRLDVIAWILVAGRYAGLFAHAWFAMRLLPPDCGAFRFRTDFVKPLFSIGGWLTVSNTISPLMGYADRFIIGALVSATAVAYYATPYEIVTKLWIVPGALTAVLFPTFAAQMARDVASGTALFRQSVTALALSLLPVCAALAIFAHEILGLWIDAEFAANSALLLQIFALGVVFNALATIPFTLIQSAERPKWTAMIHLAEVVPFLAILWWATSMYGPVGAALAWLARIVIDTVAMFAASRFVLEAGWSAVVPARFGGLAMLTFVAAALCLVESPAIRAAGLAGLSAAAAIILLREPAVVDRLAKLRASGPA